MMMDVTVSEATAQFFYEQCAGEYTGHMSLIPNNPVIHGLIKAHSAIERSDFTRFLRQCADKLDRAENNTPF